MAFNLRRPPRLAPKLETYPYQLDAVRAVQSLPYAAIFHEQGLGKTKIAIDLILSWLEGDAVDTVFIVTKKMLVQNWVNELKIHSYITPYVLSEKKGKNNLALNSPVLVYVMNYEVVSANKELIDLFLKTCRVGVVLDESQKIKNPNAQLTQDFLSLSDSFSRRVILTGTPVANRPYDLWSQIKFLDSGDSLGDSFSAFKNSVDIPNRRTSQEQYGKTLLSVMEKIKSFSVRETKKTAGLSLPSKTIVTHFVDLESRQAEIYSSYKDDLTYEFSREGEIVKDDADYILKLLLRLVQCASNPILVDQKYDKSPGKFVELISLLEDIDIQSTKVILWTGFIENVEWFSNKLKSLSPAKVHGNLPIDRRNREIEKFKSDHSCRMLLATPGAAKEGLTLTVASHAVFYDRGFSLDDYIQAQDRIHRISQTEDCFVHNLIAKQTIDEWVDVLLNAKHQAAQLTQGDISISEFEEEFSFDISDVLSQVLNLKLNKSDGNGEGNE